MKKSNAKTILDNPKQVMEYIGIWPQLDSSVSYNIKGLLAFLIPAIATILLLIQGFEDFINGNYENGSFVLCISLVTGHEAFKVWCLLVNKQLFLNILANIEDPSLMYHNALFDNILQDKIQLSNTLFRAWKVMCGLTTISLGISEFGFGYKTSPRLFPFTTDPSHLVLYVLVWTYFSVASISCGLIIASFEGLLLACLSLGIAQLQILQKEIVHAVNSYPSEINLTKEEIRFYDKLVNIELSKCVKRHNAIERFIASIEDAFTLGFLVQYGITLAVTGLLGLNFIFASVTSPDFLRCVCLFLADLGQVYLVYYHCNEIILESESVRDACYMSNWRVRGPSVRRTLFIIMERTKRPFYLTLGKFSIISLETFLVILKTSMSYFTVLKTLYVDDPNIN